MLDQVGNFLGDHPGLATACTSEHKQRAVHVGNRCSLWLIETNHEGMFIRQRKGALV